MVIFDQLRISDDGKQLYINAHVNTADYFSSIYLEKLIIMTSEKVMESEDPFCASEVPENYVYKKVFDGNQKEVALVLTPAMLENFTKSNFTEALLFVYIKCKTDGYADECFEYLPCSLQNMTTLGVTFDENMLYQKVMDYTKQLSQDCTIPQEFSDFILQWNAFKAAVETEHYKPAIKFFNMLFDNTGLNGSNGGGGCECHG